ncbi:MAG: AAA family ATPase [Bacteroidota bacterium]
MYESFYGLKEKPFSLLPDPAFLYLSRQHEMAITLLEYSLENHAGFCVITGKAGTGKTTLLRRLLNQIGDDVSIGLITNTHHSFGELLRWILHSFGLENAGDNRAGLHQVFVDYLIGQYAKKRRTMLIIDEAQNMSSESLEELRMLSNINSEKDLLLQVILVGQPPLRDVLRRPEMEQFAQRVAVDYHLDALSGVETRGYIRHRLRVAGGEPELFTDDACEAVFVHSGGIPRLINLLADLALVYAYAGHAAVITGELIGQIVSEREKHGALPIFAAHRESSTTPGQWFQDVQAPMAADVPDAATTRGVRDAAARQRAGEAVLTPAAERKTATSRMSADISGNASPVPVVRNAAAGAASEPQATSGLATRVHGAETVVVADTPCGDDVVQRAEHMPAAIGQTGKSVISVVPVAAIPVALHDAPLDMPRDTSEPGGVATSPQDLPGKPRGAKPVDAGSPRRGAKSDWIAAHRAAKDRITRAGRYVPAIAGILLISTVSLAWFFHDQRNPATAFPQAVLPARVATTRQPAEPKAADAESTSSPVPASQPARAAAPIQPAIAESPGPKKKAVEEARLGQIERDAVLAVAEAAAHEREALRSAALARERARAAEQEAALAREREHALAAEQEAARAREREREEQLAQAAEKAKQPADAVAMKASEPATPLSTATAKTDEVRVTEPAEALVSPRNPVAEPAAQASTGETATFTTNPCKSPSARFLSTCE